ncbi:MAG: phosphate ABC transporter ATP-binding protein [Saprospiraceae bacterium]
MEGSNQHIQIKKLRVSQGNRIVLRDIDMLIDGKEVIALFGPSGHGKTIMLRSFNKLFDQNLNYKLTGKIFIDNQSTSDMSIVKLRQNIGMVFSSPNLFSMSIYENLALGLRLSLITDSKVINQKIRHVLMSLHLWDTLHNKLHESVKTLTIEQQQLLCLARTLILNPKIILMEKPTSCLNSSAKSRFEDLIFELKQKYTIIVTVEDKQQAGRISDKVAFFYKGQLVEYGQTKHIFTHPKEALTESYITGRIS